MKSMTAAAHTAAGTERSRRRFGVLFAGIVTAVGVFSATSTPAFSADSGSIAATVTPTGAACLTLDKTSHAFGSLPFSQPSTPPTISGFDFVATNCGSASVKLFGRGTDATNANNSVTWTLQQQSPCTAGANNYALRVMNVPGAAAWQPVTLTKSDQQLLGGNTVAAAATASIRAAMEMPCAGSGGGGQEMSFQYVITATL